MPIEYFQSARPDAPGLILIHGYGRDLNAMTPLALLAQRTGYAVMSLTLRGHEGGAYRDFDAEDWLQTLGDIGAARSALEAEGVSADNMAVIGVDIGANLALHFALDQPDIVALVMISPGKSLKGVPSTGLMSAYGNRPVLLMASQGDTYAASTCMVLKEEAEGQCEFREYAGTYQGHDLLDGVPTVPDQIMLWLKPIMGLEEPK
ncbi:MAG: hypothetical protein AMXMBFR84_02440 [Candidatus Hydrogenedentota bacterium]